MKANIRFFERMWQEEQLLEKEERAKRQAQLMQDILAHDIRNYNQITLVNAELLKSRKEFADPESAEFIDAILNAVERSGQLIDRARKLGGIIAAEQVQLLPVDLEKSLRRSIEVVSKAQSKRSINSHFSLKAGARVMADDLLDEAFTNILSNSVNYSYEDVVPVEINVSEAGEEKGEPEGASTHPKRFWKISFTDYGPGIPDDQKDSLFTRYMESARGSGLGLSIVYALIIDRYFGKISIKNRVEGDYQKGTVIEVWIPQAS